MILTKPLGEASHAGGKLLRRGTPSYELLRAWIVAGAPGPLAEERQLVNVVLTPDRRRAKVGETFNLQVSAEYDDGSRRDVTWLTQFASNDAGVASVDPQGHVRIEGSGETALQAQFQGRVAVAIVTVPYDRPEPKFDFATNNFIDQHVQARLRELRIPASPRCDDAAFARRAYLDVLGTLPTETELRAFLADQRADKRAQLIDALLARPEFVDYWTLVWSDLFQNRKERDHDVRGTKGVRSFVDDFECDRTADRFPLPNAAQNIDAISLDPLSSAAAVTTLATLQLTIDLFGTNLDAGGKAVDQSDQRFAVTFSGGPITQHGRRQLHKGGTIGQSNLSILLGVSRRR